MTVTKCLATQKDKFCKIWLQSHAQLLRLDAIIVISE